MSDNSNHTEGIGEVSVPAYVPAYVPIGDLHEGDRFRSHLGPFLVESIGPGNVERTRHLRLRDDDGEISMLHIAAGVKVWRLSTGAGIES